MSREPTNSFFTVGGTLDPNSPSYVVRCADEELLHLLLNDRYCNIFAARQMGKSSLMVRAAAELAKRDVHTAIVDLTTIGSASTKLPPEQWYLSLLRDIARGLRLEINVIKWWSAQPSVPPVQKFLTFTIDEMLGRLEGSIVIFIDEIDSTLSLSFTDDFFGAILCLHYGRVSHPDYNRLSFVLVGVAQPADLVQNPQKDPYSLDRSVELDDFSSLDAKTLLPGLAQVHGARSEAILERILYWSGGHPYLTQKMCAAIASERDEHWLNKSIDRLAEHLFWEGPTQQETNLHRINEYIQTSVHREKILEIYRNILTGKQVRDQADSIEISRLKLSGLVKADREGMLQVRNRIYRRVFGPEWAGLKGMEKTSYTVSRALSKIFGRKG